jgi:hypothetical protein
MRLRTLLLEGGAGQERRTTERSGKIESLKHRMIENRAAGLMVQSSMIQSIPPPLPEAWAAADAQRPSLQRLRSGFCDES